MQPTKREQELTKEINLLALEIKELLKPFAKRLSKLKGEKSRLTHIRWVYRSRRKKKMQESVDKEK